MVLWVIQIYRDVNLELNKDKGHFRCTSVLFFREVILRLGVQCKPQKLKVLTDMLQAFLGTINYLGKFSPTTVEACESLRKWTSAKAEWTWNTTYQKMFEEAKAIIKEDACMKFYIETKPLCIETDASGVGLGVALLQT